MQARQSTQQPTVKNATLTLSPVARDAAHAKTHIKNFLNAATGGNISEIRSIWNNASNEMQEELRKFTNDAGNNALLEAAYHGHENVVYLLLDELNFGLGPEGYPNNHGSNVLHQAVCSGKLNLVKYLIENKKLDPQKKNKYGENALFRSVKWQVKKGRTYYTPDEHLELFKYLLITCKTDCSLKVGNETLINIAGKNEYPHIVKYLRTEALIDAVRNDCERTALDLMIQINELIDNQQEKFNTVKTFFQAAKKEENNKVTFEFDKQKFDAFEKQNCFLQ